MAEDDVLKDGSGHAERRDHFSVEFDAFGRDLNRFAVDALADDHAFERPKANARLLRKDSNGSYAH